MPVSSFLPDSGCMVAALSRSHEHHAAASAEVNRRLERGEQMVVAAHAIAETYAVLTRLPAPHRVSPADALTVLRASFIDQSKIAALTAEDYVSLLGRAPAEGISGGRIYDALIAACARKAGVAVIVTFNERHFAAFADDRLRIVVPSASDL